MFITFNTKAQALNYIKRNKSLNYSHDEGCGCCFHHVSLHLDGNKLVLHTVNSHVDNVSASATVIGKIKRVVRSDVLESV